MTYVEVTTFQHFKTMMVAQPLNIHPDGISKKLIGMNLKIMAFFLNGKFKYSYEIIYIYIAWPICVNNTQNLLSSQKTT